MKSIYEDKLQELITLSEKLLKIYDKLYNLEIKNKKDSLEYQKNISYLNLLTELEDEIYPNLSNEDIEMYINLIKETNNNITLSDFNVIINSKNNTYLLKRILNRLRLETKSRLITSFQLNNDSFTANQLLLNQFIYEDILNAFIFETNLFIPHTDIQEYKDALHMIKYIVSFLNKNIENKLKNNFNIPNRYYLISNIAAYQYDMENRDYKKLIQRHYLEYINREIREIGKSDIYNSSYSYEKYKGILQRNLLRAYLALDRENILLKKKICDKIMESNIEEDILEYINPNIITLQAERYELYGSSKRL